MYKKIIILVVTELILLFAHTSRAMAIDGFITITSPNSGTFTEGDTMHITWNSSSNIDKVNIGYKSCPSCLDWVVFTTPNTGSYDWQVNVGNTTNTQFYLQITGYETGQGSITSNSGTFTVNQNPPLNNTNPITPVPNPTTTSNVSHTSAPSATQKPKIYITPAPTQRPIYYSLTTLILWNRFIFSGSETTDIRNITNPNDVVNFTLDTEEGYRFTFADHINLTDQQMLAALQNTDKYWVWEEWYVWIKWEWWIKYNVTETIDITYENPSLTGYSPMLETTSEAALQTPSSNSKKPPKILETKPGEIKLAVSDGTPVKIRPNVTLNTPTSPTRSADVTLTGHTSHNNLTWKLSHNNNSFSVTPNINNDTGIFSIPVNDLSEGANTFILSYQEPGKETFNTDPVVVIYSPSLLYKYKNYTLFIILAFGLGYLTSKKEKVREMFKLFINRIAEKINGIKENSDLKK